MENLPSLFASLNPYVIGGSSVLLILVGSLVYKLTKKQGNTKHRATPKAKSAVKKTDNKASFNFDPDTYTVETEEHVNVPKNISGPVVLRNRNGNVNPNLSSNANKSTAQSSTPANNSNQNGKSLFLDEDKESNDPLYYIDLAKSLDRKGNRAGAIQSLKKAVFFQFEKEEKLKFESILHKYENDPFCNLRELLINKEHINGYSNDNIPEATFTYISQQKIFPKFDENSNDLPVVPTLTNSKINKVAPRMDDMDTIDLNIPQISNLSNANTSNINEFNSPPLNFTTPEELVNAINSRNIDTTAYDTKEINMSQANTFSKDNLPQQQFAHDVWVHWMSTANGKTSFKNNTIHLQNPWTSKKAVIELTEILNKESRHADGSPASWSILSINPFFDF